MSEVNGAISGDLDYTHLKGDTGIFSIKISY